MATPNTQPIYTKTIINEKATLTTEVAARDPGSANLVLLHTAGSCGSLITNIDVYYLGNEVAAKVLFLYQKSATDSKATLIGEATLPVQNPSSASAQTPVSVTLPPILYGTSKTGILLKASEEIYVALSVAADVGFNVIARGGDYAS
ncbi:MAG: hypothetical protein AAGA83_00280 [Cyanobacteria bacterium P01_F01_bin.116]